MSRRNALWRFQWLLAVAAASLLTSASAQAQDLEELEPIHFTGPINVMPIEEPDIGESRSAAAEAQVRIDHAGLRFGEDDKENRGWQFYARTRCFVWTGLDASREAIPFRRNQEQQPRRFAPLRDQPIHAQARLTMANSDDTLFQKDFQYNGIEPYELQFPVIPNAERILPGMYEIEVTVYLSRQQRQVMMQIWEERRHVEDGGVFRFERVSPRTARPVTNLATVGVAGRDFNGAYVAMPMGGAASRERALRDIEQYDRWRRQLSDLESRYDDLDEQEMMTYQIVQNNLRRIERIRDDAPEFEHELREIEQSEAVVQQAMNAYAAQMADEIEDFVVRFWQVSREIYWMSNLCLPGFHLRAGASGPNPQDPYERIDYSVPEMREMFGIGNGRFLDAPPGAMRDPRNPDDDPITGAWHDEIPAGYDRSPREQWLDWLEEEWMPQIDELREQFNRLFADPQAGIDWGIRPNNQPTYFTPLWSEQLSDLREAVENLEPTGRAHANVLAQIHTPDGEETRYPYVDDRRRRPNPSPRRASTYYSNIRNAIDSAIIEFDIRLAPEVEDDEQLQAEEERLRDARADASRAPWADQDIDPTRYSEFFRRESDGKVVTRQTYEEMSAEEQEEFDPWNPADERGVH